MNGFDIAVVVVISVAVAAVVGWLIYKKIKGKGGCCDCSSCSGCTACRKGKKKD